MSLWDWTLKAYAQGGVPEACLALQDAHGQNTSLLLWSGLGGGPPIPRPCWRWPPTSRPAPGTALALVPRAGNVRRALKAPARRSRR